MNNKIFMLLMMFILCSCSSENFKNDTGMNFKLIKSGKFIMGTKPSKDDEQINEVIKELKKYMFIISDPSEKEIYEKEKFHEVKVNSFYIQTTEVTQGQWFDIMGTKPWLGKPNVIDDRDRPAVYVSWNDVNEFIKKLNEKEATDEYRLPTEAEWEYACRSGSTGMYNFDLKESKLEEYAWFDKNSLDKNEKYAHKVASLKANEYGLFDMYGNVWEWCEDWFSSYPGTKERNIVKSKKYKIFRGGGWDSLALQCRSANRNFYYPDFEDASIGFRLVKDK